FPDARDSAITESMLLRWSVPSKTKVGLRTKCSHFIGARRSTSLRLEMSKGRLSYLHEILSVPLLAEFLPEHWQPLRSFFLNCVFRSVQIFCVASGETAWRGSNKPKPSCNRPDMP